MIQKILHALLYDLRGQLYETLDYMITRYKWNSVVHTSELGFPKKRAYRLLRL